MSQNGNRFGKFAQGFGQRGIGQRVLGFAPRLQSNVMLLGRFMPDTMEIVNSIECGFGGTAFFALNCLKVGSGGGFSGLRSAKPTTQNVQSIWSLTDSKAEPQMFVTITERTATVGTTQAKFMDAEFAKTKPAAMTLTVFREVPEKTMTATFPAEAGYAKFTWQKA